MPYLWFNNKYRSSEGEIMEKYFELSNKALIPNIGFGTWRVPESQQCVDSVLCALDCGYRFTFGGLTFYQPGDTLLLEEHMDMKGVDVLFVSPTDYNTGFEHTVRLIRMLKPERIIFQHHSTYHENDDNRFWTHGYIQETLALLTLEERAKGVIPDQHSVILL